MRELLHIDRVYLYTKSDTYLISDSEKKIVGLKL